MAITLIQQPYIFSLNQQDLIYSCISDEIANPGFRYKLTISLLATGVWEDDLTLYLSPNVEGAMVVNIREMVQHHFLSTQAGQIHRFSTGLMTDDTSSYVQVDEFRVDEAWTVDGVLTVNPSSDVYYDPIQVSVGYFNPKFGFKPNPEGTNTETSFTLNGSAKRAMSDRKWNTHKWSWGETFGVSQSTSRTFIPVRESDYGVLSYPGGTSVLSNNAVATIRIRLYDSSNTQHTFTEAEYGNTPTILACYPANLNANTTTVGIVKPEDYPGWIYYTVEFLNGSNAVCGMTYVFYNSELWGQNDCKHDVVRIAWGNSRGGWDYQNFIKMNEQSVNMERKRYQNVVGNYGSATEGAPFTYGAYEAGLNEIAVIATQYLTINSDWLQENEFEFLRGLLVARQVHWVQDDGTFLPVLIEDSDYVMKRERNGKLQKLTLKLKLANQYTR